MAKGTIARLMDRGFGFIKTEEGGDLFFHSNVLEGVEFNSLSQGQEVEFEKGQGRDGRPAAVKVKLVGTENSQDEAGVEEESETSKEEPEAGIAEEPEKQILKVGQSDASILYEMSYQEGNERFKGYNHEKWQTGDTGDLSLMRY